MRSNDELFYFLAGVTIGVIATLLITPYSGEETRQYLRERVDEGRERAGDMLGRGKDFIENRGSVSNVLGYGRKNYQEKI